MRISANAKHHRRIRSIEVRSNSLGSDLSMCITSLPPQLFVTFWPLEFPPLNKLHLIHKRLEPNLASKSEDNTLPFLIITKSSYLSMWEAEFSQRKSDINIVVYKGNKDDSRILDGIKWGMLIGDECQSWTISGHLSRIKELNAHMKQLLVNGRVKQSAARNSTTGLESSSSPHWRGNFGGGCELEDPAPAMARHLRNLRPSSTAVGLSHIPSHLPAKLSIIRASSNSSVPSCGLGQATELVKSQRQINGINQPDNSTRLPVTYGFLSNLNLRINQHRTSKLVRNPSNYNFT
ncbi:hypothetical protein Vadar_020145 [Vaccinium darrowii]|uniref:Uncharacterized protein n=1 Tax=Vaccinium darrowii TaxID=229202 RepID=A0ACB7ZKL0_9ERIC|nr:hypothetical protein Vadar_020145 [Vaccinium darrowii]